MTQNYTLVRPEVQHESIIVGEFSMFYKALLYDNVYWVHALEPRWQNVVGIMKEDEFRPVYKDSVSDGYYQRACFYQSAVDARDFIVVVFHTFDDGPSAMLFFGFQDGIAVWLGDLALFTYPSNDLPGFPEDLMSIKVVESQLQLQFKSGKYLYLHNYQEKPINGPFRFINKEKEFVLERED